MSFQEPQLPEILPIVLNQLCHVGRYELIFDAKDLQSNSMKIAVKTRRPGKHVAPYFKKLLEEGIYGRPNSIEVEIHAKNNDYVLFEVQFTYQ